MKGINYRKIKWILKYRYLRPDTGSKKRLLAKLYIKDSENYNEHRFIRKFRIAIALVAALVCLLNINSMNPQYLYRYNSENIIAIGELFSNTSLLERFIPGMGN